MRLVLLNKCNILEACLASLYVTHAELDNTRGAEVAALQASCDKRQQESAPFGGPADWKHENAAREELQKSRVAEVEAGLRGMSFVGFEVDILTSKLRKH